jgi:hemolysin III
MSPRAAPQYSPAEERLNIGSHALGFVLSIGVLLALLGKALASGSWLAVGSFGLFGLSLVTLYGVSTLYHRTPPSPLRARLRIADHAAIYALIAGTYTPFCLLVLPAPVGWVIFAVSWSLALLGIVLKLFFTGRFGLLSTLLYLAMGWMIVFALEPLVTSISPAGLRWLVAGGVAYSAGALLYSIRALPFNHALFHGFVLVGSGCHVVAVLWHIPLP